jgi:lipopolysaccharide transport system permease protein
MGVTKTGSPPVQVIRRSRGWTGLGLAELWRYRELLLVFTWRNVLVRYKQTAIGIGWAVLQPLFLMVVFTIFFGRLAGLDERTGVPYAIFAYGGLLPWLFFANSVTQSSLSLVGHAGLLRKIYFPRLVLPISSVLTALVDFVVASGVLVVLMVYYDVYPEPARLAVLPALIVLALVTSLGVGLWLSAVNVRFRDVQYAVPFLMQAWLFLTPVVYPSHIAGEPWETVLGLNPMAGVVEGFRWALLGDVGPPRGMVALSAAVAVVLLAGGAVFFKRTERSFADVV